MYRIIEVKNKGKVLYSVQKNRKWIIPWKLQDCNTHASRTPQYKSLQEKYTQLKKDKNILLLELGKIYRNQ